MPLAEKAGHFSDFAWRPPFVGAAGEIVTIPVYASRPVTRRPVAGVRVTGKMGPRPSMASLADGVATLRFRMPGHRESGEEEISVFMEESRQNRATKRGTAGRHVLPGARYGVRQVLLPPLARKPGCAG